MLLEYYTSDFDKYENVAGTGMSGKVFVSDRDRKPSTLEYKDIESALANCLEKIDQILLYYQKDGVQYYKRFNIA